MSQTVWGSSDKHYDSVESAEEAFAGLFDKFVMKEHLRSFDAVHDLYSSRPMFYKKEVRYVKKLADTELNVDGSSLTPQEFVKFLAEARKNLLMVCEVISYEGRPKGVYQAGSKYRDAVAHVVRDYLKSNSFVPVPELKDDERLGRAVLSGRDKDTEPSWYKRRSTIIGGSELSQFIVDSDKFDSSLSSKFVPVSDEDAIEAAESKKNPESGPLARGSIYEELLIREAADLLEETGSDFRYVTAKNQYKHPDIEWAEVNVDGVVVDSSGTPVGLVEVKTATSPWGDEVPLNYRIQVLHYLEVTGLDFCDVVVSVADQSPIVYKVERGELIDEEDYPHPIEYFYPQVSEMYRKRRLEFEQS